MPVEVQEALNAFNLITFGDTWTNSHVEGRAYVGGNLTVRNSAEMYHKPSAAPASSYDELYVGKSITGQNSNDGKLVGGGTARVGESVTGFTMEVNSGSTLIVGGSVSNSTLRHADLTIGGALSNSTVEFSSGSVGGAVSNVTGNGNSFTTNTGAPVSAGVPDAGEFHDLMSAGAAELHALAHAAPSVTYVDNNESRIDAAADDTIVFYRMSEAEFEAMNRLNIDLRPDQTLVIDVVGDGNGDGPSGGDKLEWRGSLTGVSATDASRILWNFNGATAVSLLANQLVGAVLAPDAHVLHQGGNHEGTIVAWSSQIEREVHSQGWTGSFPEPDEPGPLPTPIPAAFPLLAGGLGALALIARKRRAA